MTALSPASPSSSTNARLTNSCALRTAFEADISLTTLSVFDRAYGSIPLRNIGVPRQAPQTNNECGSSMPFIAAAMRPVENALATPRDGIGVALSPRDDRRDGSA